MSDKSSVESDANQGEEAGHREPAWLASQYRFLRHWLARGRPESTYWVPRVGDRVRLRGRGAWIVYAVWIRRGEVQLGDPGIQPLSNVAPARREDLDKLYGTPHWDHLRCGRSWVSGGEVRIDAEENGGDDALPSA